MKTRAYLDQTGSIQVTAWSVAKERNRLHRGGPTGRIYYSLHPAGQRKPMSHVCKKDYAPHFKYINAADEHSGGAGESLQHCLFKEAVASIDGTMLKLRQLGDYRIRITSAEVEKAIDHPDSLRRADVFFHFESETSLGLKWGGALYVEIKRSHAVDKEKLDIVRSLRLPMVEVSIPETILYEHDGETTTDELEDAYVSRIRRMLEGPTGFLACEVLNNPSTLEYLEQQVSRLRQQLAECTEYQLPMLRRQLTELESARSDAEARIKQLSGSVDRLEEEVRVQTQRAREAEQKAARSGQSVIDAQRETSRLSDQLAEQTNALVELQGQQNDWHIDGRWVLAACAVLVLAVLLIQHFPH